MYQTRFHVIIIVLAIGIGHKFLILSMSKSIYALQKREPSPIW